MRDPIPFANLLNGGWRDLAYEPFREGVDVAYLWRPEAESANEPTWAILRYQPGASVPSHLHQGLETILVLDGSQSDERGRYGAGTMIVNPEGTRHRVWSEDGCAVLIQWARPVSIL